jgi:hypothetical protein
MGGLRPGNPPDTFRSGQDFQSQRAKNRAKGVESARYSDGCCGGPKPDAVFSGKSRTIPGSIKSAKITEQPSHQDKYGANREAIRRVRSFGRPVG